MRQTIVTCGVLVLSISIHAYAGTVHFNPPSATITPGTQSVSFDVSVSWETLPKIDTVSGLMFCDSAPLEFAYAQSFVDSTSSPPLDPGGLPWVCEGGCELFVAFGGLNLAPIGWRAPLLIGTLTVATSGLLPGEFIELGIVTDFEVDLFGSVFSLVAYRASQDPLSGITTITVVPEPAIAGFMAFLMGATMFQRKQVFA